MSSMVRPVGSSLICLALKFVATSVVSTAGGAAGGDGDRLGDGRTIAIVDVGAARLARLTVTPFSSRCMPSSSKVTV